MSRGASSGARQLAGICSDLHRFATKMPQTLEKAAFLRADPGSDFRLSRSVITLSHCRLAPHFQRSMPPVSRLGQADRRQKTVVADHRPEEGAKNWPRRATRRPLSRPWATRRSVSRLVDTTRHGRHSAINLSGRGPQFAWRNPRLRSPGVSRQRPRDCGPEDGNTGIPPSVST